MSTIITSHAISGIKVSFAPHVTTNYHSNEEIDKGI